MNIRAIVDADGGDSAQIEFVEVPPAQTIDLLKQGNVDAATPNEPLASGSIASGAVKLVHNTDVPGNKGVPSSVYVAAKDFIAQNPDAIKTFVTCVQEAGTEVNGNPELAAKVAQEQLGYKPEQLTNAFYPAFGTDAVTPARNRQALRPRGQVRNPDRAAQRHGHPGRIRVTGHDHHHDRRSQDRQQIVAREIVDQEILAQDQRADGQTHRHRRGSGAVADHRDQPDRRRRPTNPGRGAAGLHRARRNQHLLGRDRRHPAHMGSRVGAVRGDGVLVGLLIGTSLRASKSTQWIIDFCRTIPTIALLPLVLLLFGPTFRMEITMIVLAAIWPLLIQSMYAARQVEPLLKWVVRVFRISTTDRLRYLWAPSVSLYVFTGLRLAATMALLMTISAEYIGGAPGLGLELSHMEQGLNRPEVFAYAITAGIIGLLINTIIIRVQRRLLWWHPPSSEESVQHEAPQVLRLGDLAPRSS